MYHQTDDNIRGQVIGLWKAGKSSREIQGILNISHNTAARWIKRYKETGFTARKDGSGRSLTLWSDEAREVVVASVTNPFLSAKAILNEVGLEDTVTPKTARNVLVEAGLHCHKALKKPFLTQFHKAERLAFAQTHISWRREWEDVVFSDESIIQSESSGAQKVYRPAGMRTNEEYVATSNRSGRVSVAVWSFISKAKIGRLHRIDGYLTSEKYRDLLAHTMIPEVLDEHFEDGFLISNM